MEDEIQSVKRWVIGCYFLITIVVIRGALEDLAFLINELF